MKLIESVVSGWVKKQNKGIEMLGECHETHRMRNPGFCRLTVIDSRAFRSRSSRYMAVVSSEKTLSADITKRTTTDRPSTLPDHVRHHTARQSQHMPALKVLSSCSLHYAGSSHYINRALNPGIRTFLESPVLPELSAICQRDICPLLVKIRLKGLI